MSLFVLGLFVFSVSYIEMGNIMPFNKKKHENFPLNEKEKKFR
jgi:hypothetical protein